MVFRVIATTLFALVLNTAAFPLLAAAATVPSFTLSVNPRYPTPYSIATITPLSTLLDLAASTMTVSVDGKQTYQGDVQPFPVTMGAPSKKVTVSVTVSSAGRKYTEGLTLSAGDVALIVEPKATAPALYPGKPHVPLAGNVRIVAVADFRTSSGTRISPSTLSYAWTIDGTTLQSGSGIGKDSTTVPIPLQYRSRSVSVVVKTPDGTQVGGQTIEISGTKPVVRVYESDPLLGVRFEKALSASYPLSGSEMSFFGVPYSFSSENIPTLSWRLNGSSVQSGNTLTVRPEGSGKGTAAITLLANTQATLEAASTNFSLSFGSEGSSFFGL